MICGNKIGSFGAELWLGKVRTNLGEGISDFFSVLENEGGNGQKKFSVKNGRELFFKSEPDEKNEICWKKIWSLGAELWACKVRTNLGEGISDFFSVLENEGGNGQKKFSVKNGRELFFKSEPDEKNEICWNKIWSLGAELQACKVRTNLARVARERISDFFPF